MSTKKHRVYTDSFKQEAVRLVLEEGYSAAEAARNLGISDKNLSRWCRESKTEPSVSSSQLSSSEKEELKRLRAENRRLVMERDILKKAAAFFAKESL